MSRPPGTEHRQQYYHDQPIDFIGSQYEPGECHNSYIMAKAGFPGYSNYPNQAGYALGAGYTTPAYTTGQIAAGYPQYYTQGAIPSSVAHPGASLASQMPTHNNMPVVQGVPVRPLESEAAVQERIKANIDAIMETQKTALLNSKLETLTNKVQSLAQNIEHSQESSRARGLACESDSSIRALSEKVDRLTRNLEQRPAAAESLSSTVSSNISNISNNSDSDIAHRLRRLAAESSARKSEELPDW